MKNKYFAIGLGLICFLALTKTVQAESVGIKNINIAQNECVLNFYRDPLPGPGRGYHLRLDAYYRAADVRLDLPAVDELAQKTIKSGDYPAAALTCGAKRAVCLNYKLTDEQQTITISKTSNLVFTVEKVRDDPRHGSGYACRLSLDGQPIKSVNKEAEPVRFLPESDDTEIQSQGDKDDINIKHVIKNLESDSAALVPKSVYDRITNVTKRSAFKYYGPNILHCIFSAAVAAAGATAIACTLGAAAPIVIPAVLGGLSSVASTGTYDIAKRVLDKEDNEYQDAIAEMKQIYRNMVYYAANTFMRTVGKTGFWFVDKEESARIRTFIDQAFSIAIKNNRQLRLKIQDTIDILSPLLYLNRITQLSAFSAEKINAQFAALRTESDAKKQIAYLQDIFLVLESMDEAIHLHAQDEGLKLALRSSLSALRFKVLETHLGHLHVTLNQQNSTTVCVLNKLTNIINGLIKKEPQQPIDLSSSLEACTGNEF